MKNNELHKKESAVFTQTRILTPEELEALKQDMWRASAWAKQQPLPKNQKMHNLPIGITAGNNDE